MNNVGIFVDIAAQYHSIRRLYPGFKLNYQKYRDRVTEIGNIRRMFAYGSQMDNEAIPFIKCLTQLGYEARYVQAYVIQDRANINETNRTIDLIADIFRVLDKLDIIVLGTNDISIVPIIKLLQERGIKVIILSCNIPAALKQTANQWIEIKEELLDEKKIKDEVTKAAE